MTNLTRFDYAVINALPKGWDVCDLGCSERLKWLEGIDAADTSKWTRRHAAFNWTLPGSIGPSGAIVIHQRQPIRPPEPPTIEDIILMLQAQVNEANQDGDQPRVIISTDYLNRLLEHLHKIELKLAVEISGVDPKHVGALGHHRIPALLEQLIQELRKSD